MHSPFSHPLFFKILILNQWRHLETWLQQVYQTNLQSHGMHSLCFNLYYTDRPGPPPSKRTRLDASEPSASGSSRAGSSSANGLDTKLSEWKPKEFYIITIMIWISMMSPATCSVMGDSTPIPCITLCDFHLFL